MWQPGVPRCPAHNYQVTPTLVRVDGVERVGRVQCQLRPGAEECGEEVPAQGGRLPGRASQGGRLRGGSLPRWLLPRFLPHYSPVDCRWSGWQPWTSCSSSCGPRAATRSRYQPCPHSSDDCGRERAVEQLAAYGGEKCQEGGGVETERCDWLNECPGWLGKHVSTGHQCTVGSSSADGVRGFKVKTPHLRPHCAVAGGWARWSSWTTIGSCSRTCGEGTRRHQRTRTCTNPRQDITDT